jgi:hypothetical protein
VNLSKFAKLTSIFVGYPWLLIIDSLILNETFASAYSLYAAMIYFLDAGLPLLMMLYFLRTKKITDWDITNREERFQILSILTLGSLISFIFLYTLEFDLTAKLFFVLFSLKFVLMMITRYWKISLHMATNTTCCILVGYLFQWNINWLLIFSTPVLYWSRLYLKKHTHTQLLAGILVSIILCFTSLILKP